MMRFHAKGLLALPVMFVMASTAAVAGPNLLTNGDFSTETLNGSAYNTSYQLNQTNNASFTGAQLTGWTNSSYAFVFTPGSADTTGAYSPQFNNTFVLWGPGGGTTSSNYSANGLPATSPAGGNFIAMDGETGYRGVLSQTVQGLTVGAAYTLSFWWAAAQQAGYGGTTTQSWTAAWQDANGNTTASYSTPTVTVASHGYSPWTQVTANFVATTATSTLAFMASGSPNGTPPFALLDGVSLTAAPEPAGWATFGVGLAALGFLYRQRKRTKNV